MIKIKRSNKYRRQEINYTYQDANIIPEINSFLLDNELEMRLIKFSVNMFTKKIKIVFKSTFETRKVIATKLRDIDVDIDGYALKQKLFFQRLSTKKVEKELEDIYDKEID